MSEINLRELWEPLARGEERIEDWWQRNGNLISTISSVNTADEVLIWSASYFRYGNYLQQEGYFKQAALYIEKSISIVEDNKAKLGQKSYEDSLDALLENYANLLANLGRSWAAYKVMKSLHRLKPAKDEYKIACKNLLALSIAKIATPMYIIIACIWGVMLLERYAFHTKFIPSVVWDISWAVWVLLLIFQFGVPPLISKFKK